MKIQLKLMVLTLALFNFANASDEVTDDVDALLGATESKKMAVKLDSKPYMTVDDSEVEQLLQSSKKDAPTDSAKLANIKKGFATLGTDLHRLGVRGAARELKCAVDWVLSPENFEKAASLYTAGKNKAWSFLDSVRRNVPGAALATTGVILLDSVSTEIVCESSIYALMLGGGLCYVASSCESQRPARNLESDDDSEDEDDAKKGEKIAAAKKDKIEALTAHLVEMLTVKEKEDKYEQHAESTAEKLKESDAKPVVDELLEEKAKDHHAASDASAGGGSLQKELKKHEPAHVSQQGGAVSKDMEAQPKVLFNELLAEHLEIASGVTLQEEIQKKAQEGVLLTQVTKVQNDTALAIVSNLK
ncbi:MAG: hypothetical protein NT128_03975 [Proteobacteria bacterium]|nr:hypothetical protein [Pseudomonadota bacterium]